MRVVRASLACGDFMVGCWPAFRFSVSFRVPSGPIGLVLRWRRCCTPAVYIPGREFVSMVYMRVDLWV